MMKTRYCLLLALPLALGACAGDDEAEVDDLGLESADAPATMEPPSDMPEMGGMATTVPLTAVGESGVSGEVILTPAGGETEVSVTLSGLEPNSTHPGHIHEGTCSAPGSVVAPLGEITADATGSGTMTTTAPVATATVTAGNHIVQYHGEGMAPIACAEIVHTM
jgi:hypothetical protein